MKHIRLFENFESEDNRKLMLDFYEKANKAFDENDVIVGEPEWLEDNYDEDEPLELTIYRSNESDEDDDDDTTVKVTVWVNDEGSYDAMDNINNGRLDTDGDGIEGASFDEVIEFIKDFFDNADTESHNDSW